MAKKRFFIGSGIGIITGFVTGIFGGGGGMILVPLLSLLPEVNEDTVFPSSICVVLAICLISILLTGSNQSLTWEAILPYLTGSFLGGIAAGIFGRKIPVQWLHRILGILILWGGIRYLWQPAS